MSSFVDDGTGDSRSVTVMAGFIDDKTGDSHCVIVMPGFIYDNTGDSHGVTVITGFSGKGWPTVITKQKRYCTTIGTKYHAHHGKTFKHLHAESKKKNCNGFCVLQLSSFVPPVLQ